MLFSLYVPLAILFFLFLVSGLDDTYTIFIYAPDEVTADVPFEAQITTEVYNGETEYCNAFRVYLATSADDDLSSYFYDSDCMTE
jgi:hypothetical protein